MVNPQQSVSDYETAYEATKDALETVCKEFGVVLEWDEEGLPALTLHPGFPSYLP